MRGPRNTSAGGRSVVANNTAAVTTRRPPIPTDLVSVAGVSSREANPIRTVPPLITTARPAVPRVRTAASGASRPRFTSSLNRVITRSE